MFSTGYGALNRSLGVTQHQSRQYMENMQNISLREQSSANTRPTVTVRAVAAGRLSSCQKYLHFRPWSGSSYAPLCLQVSHNLNSLKELLQSRRIILFERFHISSQTALTHQPPKGQRGSFSYKHIFLSRPALALWCTDLWNKTPSPPAAVSHVYDKASSSDVSKRRPGASQTGCGRPEHWHIVRGTDEPSERHRGQACYLWPLQGLFEEVER